MSTLTAQSVANTTTSSNQKGGRLINKDKKSQLNKPTQNASNSAQSTGDNNHANHLNEGSKLDSKLQPTAEQIRIANLMNENIDDNEIQKKVEQIMELTGSTRDDAVVALHDCDNDTAKAVDMILEGDNNAESEWKSTNKKKKTPKVSNEKDESKVNGNKEAKNDETTESNKPAFKGDRRGRGANNRIVRDGPPRLQKTAQQINKGKKPRDFVDKKTERTEKPLFERDESNTANTTARRSDKPLGESRRGRGSNSNVSRGNRGGRSRTFQNRGLQNDGFPNSIDTWTNSTADQKPVPSNDCNTMTVGNWSDIVANEDWSEEDWDSNHMETKVFTSRIKVLPEEEVPTTQSLDFSSIFNKANSSVEQNTVQQQTISSMIQNNLPRNASSVSNSAGNALLQQIQQATSSAPMTQYSSLTSDYNKQAAASIKSLVGISSTYNSSDLLPSSTQEIVNSDLLANSQSRHSQLQQSNLSNMAKQQKFKSMRPSKIPESAVEMPTNDQIAKLDVQFGGLEFGSDSLSFSLGNEVFQEPVGHVKGNKVATPSASTLLGGDTNYRQSNNMTDITNKSLSGGTNQVKNTVIGHQNLTAEALLDRASKSVGHYGQSNLVDIGKSSKDYSSLNSQNIQGGDNYKTTYSNESGYNSSYSNVTTSYSYTNSQTGNYYSNSFSANPTSNAPSTKLNLDNSQTKHYDVSTGQVTNVGTMGLVSTTNVLKNSLSATGKTLHNVAHPVQTMGQYIHINQAPAVPLAAYPFAYDFMPNAGRDHNFAPYTSQDGKYNRGSETDISSVSTSQPVASSQTHNQAFVNFPPGYGAFYFHPGVVPGIQQSIYGATPMYQVNPATNTGTTNSAFQKANTGYGSHSYGSGYDSLSSAQTQDYVKSGYNSSTQHAKNISAANTSDLTGANQSMYGKTHTQLTKNYDKQTFQTNTPPPLTFGNSNLASQTAYGQPYTMLNQAQTSLHHGLQQDPSKVGATGQRTMASHKPSGQNAGTYYGNWN